MSRLAARDWDVIVVGGGHNGLTAAAYMARAGRSVLVLERRDRLGGAATLERPFADERFVVSPCAYVVGLLDQLVIDELELERRGLRYWVADPNLWVPFEDGTSFAQWLDDAKTQANLEELGVSARDIEGYWAYEELFDEVRRKLRKGERDTWVGESPSRAELEDLLGGDQAMIDLLFEASIADVLDEYISDERLKTALFGQGIIGTWGGPREPGTASIKLMHYQGDLDGRGPVWGYVEGGMGMVSFAIADAAREAGATLACGVPVAEIMPGEGVRLEDGTALRSTVVLSNADPKVTLRLLDGQGVDQGFRDRLDDWKIRSPVVKFNASLERLPDLDGRARRGLAGAGDDRRHGHDGRGPARVRGLRARRAGGRVRRDLHPDRLRPVARAGGQAPAERVRPVRALRPLGGRLGFAPRRRGPAVHRPDQALRPGPRGLPRRPRGPRPARHRVAHRAHRRQHLPGRGHAGPDVGAPPHAAHAGARPLPLRRRHSPRGERDRPQRAKRRRRGPGRRRRGAADTQAARAG